MKIIIALLLSATGAAAFTTGVKAATVGLGTFATSYPTLPDEIFAPAAKTAFPVKQDDLRLRHALHRQELQLLERLRREERRL